MPSRVIRRSTRRTVRSRRRHQWVDVVGDVSGLAVGAFNVSDLFGTYRPMDGAETAGITIIRTHLRIWVTSAVVTGDGLLWALIVDDQGEVVTTQNFGTAHAFNPQDQPYLPWMMYKRENAHPHYSMNGAVDQWEIDIRSKRKVPFGDTYLLVLGNVDASAAVSFSYHARTLIALS